MPQNVILRSPPEADDGRIWGGANLVSDRPSHPRPFVRLRRTQGDTLAGPFGAKPKGKITVDDGAKEALLKRGKRLLLTGVVHWEGHFKVDDVVIVVDREGQEIARGVVNYSVADLVKTVEKKGKHEVIHRDKLVLCKR